MARVAFLLLLAAVTAATAQQAKEFEQTDSCGRCHVSSVLEWSLSKHQQVNVSCVACHGASVGHMLDERNNVKPDRILRGKSADALCLSCHSTNKQNQKSDCLSCHHPHALVNPSNDQAIKATQDQELKEVDARLASYRQAMTEGEKLLVAGAWSKAEDSFQLALKNLPDDQKAAAKLRVAGRRMHPGLAGFEIVGSSFNASTGLPTRVKVIGTDIEMVLIPGGRFDMGSERFSGSVPMQTVYVKPFYLSTTELTQGQWKAIMGSEMLSAQKGTDGDRNPMTQISWDDSEKFVAAVNAHVSEGGFRLPTEAEWEYAARAGTTYAPPASELARVAWFSETTVPPPSKEPARVHNTHALDFNPYGQPRQVATKQPNAWGLYDMLGNVWEWCSSLNQPYPYNASDGREALNAAGLRILRGGGFADSADYLDPALRHSERHDLRLKTNGMRLARSIPPSS